MAIASSLAPLIASLCLAALAAPPEADSPAATPVAEEATVAFVRMTTNRGEILLELDAAKAPRTVENFLDYVRKGHYDGTVFHRVIPTFMIQGGGFDAERRQKPTGPPIPNEAANGLSNRRGTIAMARTNDPDSATAQFFINVVDNPNLDPRPAMPGQPASAGYAVFGRVVSGMEAVDAIRFATTADAMATTPRGQQRMQNWPVSAMVIEKAEIVPPPPATPAAVPSAAPEAAPKAAPTPPTAP
jgi:peptidyl-prolyl cis-trans isomerase A (cyclophilin A)